MKKRFNKNVIFSFILGLVIMGSIGVGASAMYYASQINYSNDKTEYRNVNDALNELYELSIDAEKPFIKARENEFIINNIEEKKLKDFFNYNNDDVICKVGNVEVTTTDDLINIGLLDEYKVDCTIKNSTSTASIIIKFNKIYIFYNGIIFNELSSGFTKVLSQAFSGSLSGDFSVGGNNASFTMNAAPKICASIIGGPNKKIDFTHYSKMGVELYSSTGGVLGISSTSNGSNIQNTSIPGGITPGKIVYLNISDSNRKQYYPYVNISSCQTGDSIVSSKILISKWWIEK